MNYKLPTTYISKASLLFALSISGVASAQTTPAATPEAEEIVITGMRAALEKAIEVKQSSDKVMEALSMDDINATPAVTIAEALVRLPGVNGSRDRGNESQAAIRGLGPRMVFGTVNGREVASPEPGRAIRYEQYPSELVSAAEVYKTQSADLIEGGIAGSINLKTISPLSYNGPEATIRAGVQQNEAGKDIPDYDPLGNRFSAALVHKFSDEFAVAIGASKQKQKNAYGSLQGWGFSSGDWNLDGKGAIGSTPWGVAAEVKKLEQDREGVMAVMEWAPSDTLNVKYDFLYTSFAMSEEQNQTWGQDIGLNPGPWGGWGIEDTNKDGRPDNLLSNVVLVNKQAVAATINGWEGQIRHVLAGYSQENSGITQGLKFSYTGIDNWKIDADISSSTAKRENYWNAIYLDQYAETWSYDLRGTPSISAPAGSALLTPEKASYNWISNVNEGSDLEDDLLSAQFDFKRDLDAGDLRSLTFGVRTADREKEVIWTDFAMTRTDAADNGTAVKFPAGFLSSYTLDAFDTIPFLNAPSYKETAQLIYGGVNYGAAAVNEGRYWKVEEKNNAGYVKLDFEGELAGFEYDANVGVRQVKISTESYALNGAHVDNDFSKALPSAGLNLSLDDQQKLRFGVSRAISRPPLDEMRAGQYISAINTGSSGGAGNPLLKPFTSDQVDVSYEWYFAPESLAALSVYYKDIENYIGNATVGSFTGQQGTFDIYGPVNGKGGYVRGAELTFQMPFTFLPVEGFGIYSNYAFAESNIHEFAPSDNPLPMAGLARDTATLDLWYSNYGVDARIGWKYHSAYTSAFTWDSYDLTTMDSELSLGLSLAYDINEHWNVRFQAYNLTNEPMRLSQNNQPANLKRFDDYGRSYLLDFTWKL
ncbi:TonB-dependent receptor [Cellvibrio zantedeschiae]|uniref:TonB-dependent receptor n=1 Tax=Cellvibrio zantedeschiae TaxID=1237077 RepID=A0ABQ3B540_9GAMM|nr:TonB-dependent receptor [Cellvibrio zantedeschiae]GGY78621.1 TonB-dependent receptor [Cellvibrio zantedeschiae]